MIDLGTSLTPFEEIERVQFACAPRFLPERPTFGIFSATVSGADGALSEMFFAEGPQPGRNKPGSPDYQ